MNHLVIYSERELNKIRKKRRARLIWVRKRREPPVAVVAKGDKLYFKSPGGGVFAWTKVTSVKDQLKNGRYVVTLGINRPHIFSVSFPVLKRDRRSWVVCSASDNINQQQLITLPSPTLEEIEKAIRKHYRKLPSKKEILQAIKFFAQNADDEEEKNNSAILFLLAIIIALKNDTNLYQALKPLLNQHPTKVFPLSIFRGK